MRASSSLAAHLRLKVDMPLLLLTYTLAAIGVVVIYCATYGDPAAFYRKQLLWITLGTAALAVAATLDYHLWVRFATHLYGLNLVLLAAVLKLGHATNGAARWIRLGSFPFQPSEHAKLIVVFTLAVFLAKRSESIRQPGTVLRSLLYVAVPMLLILKQPDLGTALVLGAIWLGMVYMAGAQLKHLAAIFATGLLLFTGMWFSGTVKDYQKARIVNYVNQEANPKGSGYHVMQARIAIGSGGMWGKGLLRSTQVRGGYIPERQTDFIFTEIGEELGFVGTLLVTALYGALLLRGTFVIAGAEDDLLGKLIATGIVTMIAFHVIVNIGMNVGILPVAGVPLTLISYGGNNVLVTLLSIGLLQSIVRHRRSTLF